MRILIMVFYMLGNTSIYALYLVNIISSNVAIIGCIGLVTVVLGLKIYLTERIQINENRLVQLGGNVVTLIGYGILVLTLFGTLVLIFFLRGEVIFSALIPLPDVLYGIYVEGFSRKIVTENGIVIGDDITKWDKIESYDWVEDTFMPQTYLRLRIKLKTRIAFGEMNLRVHVGQASEVSSVLGTSKPM